jgi:hypothetical protein
MAGSCTMQRIADPDGIARSIGLAPTVEGASPCD